MAGTSESSAPRRVLRTVTPPYRGREDREMSVIGLGLFAALVILFVPLLPFIVIVWLLAKLIEVLRSR